MGEAFAGQTVGRKAVLWGILAQSIPDIDFIASSWMDTPSGLLAHRGLTHSILFAVIVTVIMALLANRWHRPHNITLSRWTFFFCGNRYFIYLNNQWHASIPCLCAKQKLCFHTQA